jgi:glyoxalase family protein
MPGVVAAGAEHAGDVGGGGDAHAGAHVAEIAGVLEQHDGCAARVGEQRADIDMWALGECHDACGWRKRREPVEHARVDLAGELQQPRAQLGRELAGQPLELAEVAGEDIVHCCAEAQRVLERVKAFKHRQRGIASRAPKARDKRSVLHSSMIACRASAAGHRVLDAVKLEGIHHISAITGDARRNVEFYTGVLGLRMVKRTVNQDEPNMYHLFYGDEHGSPGMDLTFFEYPGAARGIAGAGMVHRIVWRVASSAALEFWEERLASNGVRAELAGGSLLFADPEGLEHEFVRTKATDAPLRAESPEIPSEHALQGFEGVRAYSSAPVRSERLLSEAMGFARGEGEHWEARGEHRASFYAYDPAPPEINRTQGAGTVHHVAFAAVMDDLDEWRSRVAAAGARPTPVIDRFYFKSVYFLEPSGVLFEIATIGPGFAVDEDQAHLGEALSLPPALESLREKLQGTLTPLPYPPAWRAGAGE